MMMGHFTTMPRLHRELPLKVLYPKRERCAERDDVFISLIRAICI